MTKTETERLTRVEEKLQGVKDDVKEIKELLKKQNENFITRLEGKVAVGALSMGMAVIAFWISVKDYIK
tara:strand:- start:817 stop:1023 length:207 start_codon:yes stop_codon:yes gene_type:complete